MVILLWKPLHCFYSNYWIHNSGLKRRLDRIFWEKYEIDDVIHNDIDAIVARIKYVQNREESSWREV